MTEKDFLVKMETIQNKFMEYLNDDIDIERNYQQLIACIDLQHIKTVRCELKSFLHFLSYISKYHHQTSNFFDKIEKVLLYLKNDITSTFTKFEIFHIFKKQKVILLFLHQNEIMTFDKAITNLMIRSNRKLEYLRYFYPEIKEFLDEMLSFEVSEELPENFEERRKKIYNDDIIAEFIRNDSVVDFIKCYEKTNFSLSDKRIHVSFFETISLLINKKHNDYNHFPFKRCIDPTLIEYAALFGSIQIFRYLIQNGIKLDPFLWYYAIHSNNAEMIHLLEENQLEPDINFVIREAIKCHHNDIADYLLQNLCNSINSINAFSLQPGLKYHNFQFIDKSSINKSLFCYLCMYDYYPIIVQYFNTSKDIDVDHEISCIAFLFNFLKEFSNKISIHHFKYMHHFINNHLNDILSLKFQ